MSSDAERHVREVCETILKYLLRCQDLTPGEYYGSFWSEKAYHGPLLDYHAGGAHHNRTAGSAALALWLIGKKRQDAEMMHRAELAFDWLAARQRPSGGYFEIQNNETPSDWERTGLEECSTIATGFAAHGLGHAVLAGLPPKKSYFDCLQKVGHWVLSIEWPPGSGIFPHHERSPYDTLNANLHAAESLMSVYAALRDVYERRLNIFLQGARRSVVHTLTAQWPSGCFPYRTEGGITINYTSLVLWCLLNILDLLAGLPTGQGDLSALLKGATAFAPAKDLKQALSKATAFLCSCVGPKGEMLWEKNETSTAKHNIWPYAITYNVLRRVGGKRNTNTAARLLKYLLSVRTPCGLLPMRDEGEEVTECAYMQADMLLFLLPFSGIL
ncbi:MAG: hypothetical protein AB1696_05235 [Planctomycetota bacterium]